MKIRPSIPSDAGGMSDMLVQLVKAGKRSAPSDPDFVMTNYITHPDGILCSVAVDDDDSILGLQSLRLASEGNQFGTPVGWGIIGTHVSPLAARRGIGGRLFEASLSAARGAWLKDIEAFIGDDNVEGLAYYEAMGFRTYRLAEGKTCKQYRVAYPQASTAE